MATFPKAEARILALARPEDFPNMPVSADELQAMLDEVEADVISP